LSGAEEHGFLWRLNTYWSYEERDGGLTMQIESVSLTGQSRAGWGGLWTVCGVCSARVAGVHAAVRLQCAREVVVSGFEKPFGEKGAEHECESCGEGWSGVCDGAAGDEALTARMEKRALQWMAERAPRWITSDQLTVLGLGAQIGAGLCYALARYNRLALLGAIVCIALNWLGDSMDGTLARVRRRQRPRYGFYVDHMVDIFGSVALMCGLGFRGCCMGRRRLRC